MTVAMALKKWREKNGITQVELAAELGVSVRTVSRWEAGLFAPDLAELKRMEKKWPGITLMVMR